MIGKHVWWDNEKPVDTTRAERVVPREVKRRTVREAGRRFVAYDAHSLMDAESAADGARPGHPLG